MSEHTYRPMPSWQLVGLGAIFCSGFLLFSQQALPDTGASEIHYAPAENLEAIDVELIDAAKNSIDLAAYVLTDVPVIQALTRAAQRGVSVRIFRDIHEHESADLIVSARDVMMNEPHVSQKFTSRHVLMHLKSYCIDGKTLRTGAANFSASGLKQQDNDLIILLYQCASFEANFNKLWGR